MAGKIQPAPAGARPCRPLVPLLERAVPRSQIDPTKLVGGDDAPAGTPTTSFGGHFLLPYHVAGRYA